MVASTGGEPGGRIEKMSILLKKTKGLHPVFVSSGETYERSCIDKWFEAGHGTCPKTQKTLSSTVRTPNNVLRSLVAQFCEAKGTEQRKGSLKSESASACSPAERSKIESLLRKLTSGKHEEQRLAAGSVMLITVWRLLKLELYLFLWISSAHLTPAFKSML
ncbi:hypothetical protein RIF29_40640 [Crotalaria pallida]|uniref:U-box domain-containing protein n=1 Tax=Crotalaria pallida TaxID=3830 RepID=A0AAN9HNN0_CROPI